MKFEMNGSDKQKIAPVIGRCEYCGLDNVELQSYDLEDGDFAMGCVDEERCRQQMNYNEWGS
ncbi:hypothetical protein [Paenibacillus sp. CGMCC 1.18879]|nr:hypothetical protein [Paenibacillus sp. CGMCC 1.18879]MBY9082609.1 hypothetical protein [Paenibacillus sp. CGMCC 1.18879]